MDDNSLQINIEAVDDASGVLEGVAETAAEMSQGLVSAAEESNNALASIGTSAMSMSEEAQASINTLNEIMAVDSADISEEAIAMGTSFDAAAQEILGANEEIQVSNDDMKISTGLAAGALLLLSQQLKSLAASATGEIKDAYTETGTWDQTLIGLQQTLSDTGSKIPLSDLENFAKQMQSTTLFQQQQTLGAEEQVMSYKNLQPQYQQITELAADLATKQVLVHGGTLNLGNAMRVLSDALENPINAMSRLQGLGVTLDPTIMSAIQKTAKAGDTAAASARLMNELTGSVGGLAQKMHDAPGTGFTKFQNDLTSMQQNMPGLTTDLDNLANTLDRLLKPLAQFVNDHPTLTANVLLATAAILSIAAALTGFAAQILILRLGLAPLLPLIETAAAWIGGAFAAALGVISGPLLLLIALIIILAAVWIANWKAIKDEALFIWDALKTGFGDAVTWITNLFTGWFTTVMGYIDKVVNALKNVGHSIGGAASSAGGALVGGLTNLGHAIGFADGGIVTSPTFAMVGEAGPEAIIPLSAFNNGLSLAGVGSGGGNGGINVYITGQVYTTEDQAKRFGDSIAKQLNRQLKLASFR